MPIALGSEYDFDRIAAYLYLEKRRPSEPALDLDAVRREFERRRIKPDGSYMALYYSLRALSKAGKLGRQRAVIERELRAIEEFLLKGAGKEKSDPLFSATERVRAALRGPPAQKKSKRH